MRGAWASAWLSRYWNREPPLPPPSSWSAPCSWSWLGSCVESRPAWRRPLALPLLPPPPNKGVSKGGEEEVEEEGEGEGRGALAQMLTAQGPARP